MLIGRFMKIIGFRMKWEVLESYIVVVLDGIKGFGMKIFVLDVFYFLATFFCILF